METIVHTIDLILYICMGISVIYLFVFAFASLLRYSRPAITVKKLHRFAVLFPAYNEDRIILSSVSTFLRQDYPKDLYDVIVISDHMQQSTDQKLTEAGATVIKANYSNSSKAKAMQLAMNTLDEQKYDAVVIMDGDNLVEPNFLGRVNQAYDAGYIAIQGHRTAKNRDTSTALLDALSEEMNNSIFRKGHVRLGLSSALIGSGMTFNYQWFKTNIFLVSTAGEDKELEALLLKQRIRIEYLDAVRILDEKVRKDTAFYNQRRRWLASHYGILRRVLPDLPKAIATGNLDYADKILQWIMLPRIMLLGAIGALTVLFSLYDWNLSLKWWGLLLFLIITILIAIPRYLLNKSLVLALWKVPWLGILMFANLFRLRGVNKKFIHTDHNV